MNTTKIKLYDTDYVWFDGQNIDMKDIYSKESVEELFEDGFELEQGEKFIKMTELRINIQNDFIHKIETNAL